MQGNKRHKKHQKALKAKNTTKQRHKNANKQTKIKNALKNIFGEKVPGNVDPTKLGKALSALYEQKIVY